MSVTMTTSVGTDPRDLNSATGRFCSWLVLCDSDLALDMRARAWGLARQRWKDRRAITNADRAAIRAWLDQELDDVFDLAAYGQNPELRAEAFRVRIGVGRPWDVDLETVVRLLQRLYRNHDVAAEWSTPE